MLYRKIEKFIKSHLQSSDDKILLIDGARQIGKSYIIRYVGQKEFSNYIEINMEEDKLGDRLFADVRTVRDFYLTLSINFGNKMGDKHNTLVFIDEIQAYDHLFTLLKFLREDGRFTYIASGSRLGIALKQTSSLPLGSILIKHMYPLDFEEFLIANGVGQIILDTLYDNFAKRKPMPTAIHNKLMSLFRHYLLSGGLPDAVNKFIEEDNIQTTRASQDAVYQNYGIDAAKYEQMTNRRLSIQRIYEMIPSNLEKTKKRIIAKDIEGKTGKRMSNYAEEFEYLIASGIALEVKAISTPTFPLIQNSGKNLLKLYMNDVGLLTSIYYRNNPKAVLDDVPSINLGSVYETVVAQELKAHGFSLYYYDNKQNGEVDFLIDDVEHLSITPIEVKSGKDYKTHSALNKFVSNKHYNIHRAYVLSNEQKVSVADGITYMPIYYIMCFKNE
ncbi:ATP-binding protein [Prevotella intermedia]|uniref:ATP-binding protein n=1 Tax=Prevotella intermedia TaxID=28131 RepID=UPI000C1C4247|nr:AAA family ATPase [Prevotella intermedia]ATV28890.1 ATPase [Prevotella intermedia]MCK6144910.1 AAA family ATPase [Prevotella intermedia]